MGLSRPNAWSTTRTLVLDPESPGNGVDSAHSDTGPIHPGQLINPAGARTKARVAVIAGRPRGPSETSASPPGQLVDPAGLQTRARVSQESWSIPRALRHERESRRSAGPYRGTSDTARVALDSWSTPRAIGPERVWPGTEGRHRGPMDKGPRRPGVRVDPRAIRAGRESSGQLVELAGSRTRARVSQES